MAFDARARACRMRDRGRLHGVEVADDHVDVHTETGCEVQTGIGSDHQRVGW
jgi:hypothetical protein